ncbi:JAB domain-containing protein [Flavisolibacter sp. BT320]|nr:JAB domain-containing protein [Flavisolibacter longurius]
MDAILPAVAEITVVYRNKQKAQERQQITSSADAHRLLLSAFNPDTIALQEEFAAMYLNRANQVIGIYRVGVGGVTGVVCDPRLILAVALKTASVGLIICHNHPSGTLRPSRQDEDVTIKLKEGARFMDIKLLDHLIVAPDGVGYFSFADDGLL